MQEYPVGPRNWGISFSIINAKIFEVKGGTELVNGYANPCVHLLNKWMHSLCLRTLISLRTMNQVTLAVTTFISVDFLRVPPGT